MDTFVRILMSRFVYDSSFVNASCQPTGPVPVSRRHVRLWTVEGFNFNLRPRPPFQLVVPTIQPLGY